MMHRPISKLHPIARIALTLLPHLVAYYTGLYAVLQHPGWHRTLYSLHNGDCGWLLYYAFAGNMVAISAVICLAYRGFRPKNRQRTPDWVMRRDFAYILYAANLVLAVLWRLMFVTAKKGNYFGMLVVALAGLVVAVGKAVVMYMFDQLAEYVSCVHVVYMLIACATTWTLYYMRSLAEGKEVEG